MNFNFATTDTRAWAPPPVSIEHLIERIELLDRCRDLQRRAVIAQLKLEHGMLTAEEQDLLLEEGDLLKRAIKNWRTR